MAVPSVSNKVMQAVMKQLKNPLSLFKGPEALGKVYSLTSTNMSMTDMLDLGLSNAGSFKRDQFANHSFGW